MMIEDREIAAAIDEKVEEAYFEWLATLREENENGSSSKDKSTDRASERPDTH